MKKEKSIIIILLLIIAILGVIITLLATGTITINNNKEQQSETENKEEEKESNEEEEKSVFEISYKEEEYITKNNKGYTISKSKRNLPIIENKANQSSADKIVASLTTTSDIKWNNEIKPASDTTSEMDSNSDLALGVTLLYSNGPITDNRLTFNLELSGAFGGTSWSQYTGYNYDAETGELLTIDTISDESTTLKNIIDNEVIKYLETNKKDSITSTDWQTEVSKITILSGNWYFKNESIEIVIPKYSILAGYEGITKIEIDKNKVNPYLKDKYKI